MIGLTVNAACPRWTPEEDALLHEYRVKYGRRANQRAAAALGRSLKAVEMRINTLRNIAKRQEIHQEPDPDEVLRRLGFVRGRNRSLTRGLLAMLLPRKSAA
jgi:hypothetical protein